MSTPSQSRWNFAITVVSATAGTVAFFTFVRESIIDKLIGLPWQTILVVGVPLVIAAITTVRQAFMPKVTTPKDKPDA